MKVKDVVLHCSQSSQVHSLSESFSSQNGMADEGWGHLWLDVSALGGTGMRASTW